MEQQNLLYDQRFLETYAGAIVTDPATAIVELVANCWDAYSTGVNITWPDAKTGTSFAIEDDGHGMTRDEFRHIWRTFAYNRLAHDRNDLDRENQYCSWSHELGNKIWAGSADHHTGQRPLKVPQRKA